MNAWGVVRHNGTSGVLPVRQYALLALTAGAGMAQTVRLGTEGAYPPFNFLDDAGNVAGFERELGDELCNRVAEATNKRFFGDGKVPYTPPKESPKF